MDDPSTTPRRGRPHRTEEPTTALFVRIPTAAAARLDRAALELRTPKRDLVTTLVTRYVDPGDRVALEALRASDEDDRRRVVIEREDPDLAVGRLSFRPAATPEVLTASELAALLQVDEAVVVDLAARAELPGRRVGAEWRFSRAAVLAWLGETEPTTA
jgi:excisionase family DNA binding protein